MGGGVEGAAPARGGIRPILPGPAPGPVGWRARADPGLARDLPALWRAATTTAADRQRIVRLLVKEVVVTVRGESERVDVTIHWAGGFSSDHELVRPVQRYQQMADFERLLNRIDELSEAGQTLAEVAEELNREGFHPPKRSANSRAVSWPDCSPSAVGRVRGRGPWGSRASWESTSGC